MKNRAVGFLVIGIAILVGFIIYSFDNAMRDIVSAACSHGPECPMWGTIDFQTNVSLGIMVFIVAVGLYLVISGKEEKPGVKDITKDDYKDVLDKLEEGEKNVFEKIIESKGSIFQSELVEKTGMQKVKVTRVLDKLEGKGFIERKRRGMTNIVILKHKH
jgi:uncharacterized membrane protein